MLDGHIVTRAAKQNPRFHKLRHRTPSRIVRAVHAVAILLPLHLHLHLHLHF